MTSDPPKAFAVIERCFDRIAKGRDGDADGFLGLVKKLSRLFEGKYRSQIVSGMNRCSAALQEARILTAQEMVDSYDLDWDYPQQISTFIVPAGVTDVEAMKALNEYFRKYLSRFCRDAVCAEDFDWYKNLPKNYPQNCQERGYSQARQIKIIGVVKDSKGTCLSHRAHQCQVLTDNNLSWSDPRDQAIAAGLHACKNDGLDLFLHYFVRGSVSGRCLKTHDDEGVRVHTYYDFYNEPAASGSPAAK